MSLLTIRTQLLGLLHCQGGMADLLQELRDLDQHSPLSPHWRLCMVDLALILADVNRLEQVENQIQKEETISASQNKHFLDQLRESERIQRRV